ncbi:MAG: tetratricopeptide repeat protein [Mangrovibacterium sp.]|nr:tetratricopeptide repeat protein [Mangrovibacterium sp.]
MNSLLSKTRLFTLVLVVLVGVSAYAQRVITGTVYREGKVAAGVTVEAHKSSDVFMTSFDGKYKITADAKSKYLKFTFIDDSRKLDIENNSGDVIDFSFDGELPEPRTEEPSEAGVDTRTSEQLVKAKVTGFMSSYTMYDQAYKQKDYKSAMGPWRLVFLKYPKSSINIYIHGANMYSTFIESSSDQATKDAYTDSLMMVYDRRIKYFDQKGFVLGRKATDYLTYKLENQELTDDELKAVLKTGYNDLKQAIDLEKNETEMAVLVFFMQVTRRLFSMEELKKEDVSSNYALVSAIVDTGLAKEPESEKYTTAKTEIDRLFQTSGAADCEALIALYEPKFEEISKDVDALKNMLRVLGKQECTGSDLWARASEQLYALDPSPEAAFNMARLFMRRDEFNKAKEYYQNAVASETDKELLAKCYYELGVLTFAKENNFQQARAYARKALENNPNHGKALILIGDIYAHYSKNYGKEEFDHLSLYWLAVDYYEKAKRVDPEVFSEANNKINTYRVYFPDKETLFFGGYQDGQTITFGSWINESSRIRARR